MLVGLDVRLCNVAEIKGIKNCVADVQFGVYESCYFNIKDCGVGGIFSVANIDDTTLSTQDLLAGDIIVTFISQKRHFETLCDGVGVVNLFSDEGNEDTQGLNSVNNVYHVFPPLFKVLGQKVINVKLYYYNKGPIRIYAGSIEVGISVIDLSNAASHDCIQTTNCKLCDSAPDKATPTLTAPQMLSSDSSVTNGDSDGQESSFSVDVTDDIEIAEFMKRFDLKVNNISSNSNSDSAKLTGGKDVDASTHSKVNGPKKKKTKTKQMKPKYWLTSEKIVAVPARTDLKALKQLSNNKKTNSDLPFATGRKKHDTTTHMHTRDEAPPRPSSQPHSSSTNLTVKARPLSSASVGSVMGSTSTTTSRSLLRGTGKAMRR